MTLAEMLIKFRITGTVDVKQGLNDVKESADAAGNSARMALTPIEELGKRLYQLARYHLGFMAVKKSLEDAAKIDSLRMALRTVEGSTDAVAQRMADLRKVALLPGVDLNNAVHGFIRLRSAGMGATESLTALRTMGNAIASLGGGKEAMEGVIKAMTQIQGLPSLMGAEIIQLTQWLPNAGRLIKDAFGTMDTDELRKRGISGSQAFQMILQQMQKIPPVQLGIQGNMELIADQFQQTSASAGNFVAALLRLATPAILGSLEKIQFFFQNIGRFKAPIMGLVGALTTIGTFFLSGAIVNGVSRLGKAIWEFAKIVRAAGIVAGIGEAIGTGGVSAIGSLLGGLAVLLTGIATGSYLSGEVGKAIDMVDQINKGTAPGIGGIPAPGSSASGSNPYGFMTGTVPAYSAPFEHSKGYNIARSMMQGWAVNNDRSGSGGVVNVLEGLVQTMMRWNVDYNRTLQARLGEIADNTRKTASALDLRQEMIGGGVLARAGVTAGERRSEMASMLVSQFAGATVTVGGSYLERQIRKVVQDERRRGLNLFQRS